MRQQKSKVERANFKQAKQDVSAIHRQGHWSSCLQNLQHVDIRSLIWARCLWHATPHVKHGRSKFFSSSFCLSDQNNRKHAWRPGFDRQNRNASLHHAKACRGHDWSRVSFRFLYCLAITSLQHEWILFKSQISLRKKDVGYFLATTSPVTLPKRICIQFPLTNNPPVKRVNAVKMKTMITSIQQNSSQNHFSKHRRSSKHAWPLGTLSLGHGNVLTSRSASEANDAGSYHQQSQKCLQLSGYKQSKLKIQDRKFWTNARLHGLPTNLAFTQVYLSWIERMQAFTTPWATLPPQQTCKFCDHPPLDLR